jgi:hypothetical protein
MAATEAIEAISISRRGIEKGSISMSTRVQGLPDGSLFWHGGSTESDLQTVAVSVFST